MRAPLSSHPNAMLLVAWLLVCLTVPTDAHAHSPHDEVMALQFSPAFAVDLVLFAIVRFNLVRSRDRGLTWSRRTHGLAGIPLIDVAVSPGFARDQTVFAVSSTSGIRRSTDGGDTWRPPARPPPEVRLARVCLPPVFETSGLAWTIDQAGGLWVSSDGGESWSGARTGAEAITCLAFLGTATLAGTATGKVLQSDNAGSTWEEILRLPDRAKVGALAAIETGDRRSFVAVGTERGRVIILSQPAGHVRSIHRSSIKGRITSLAWASAGTDAPILFATTWAEGVQRTRDLGGRWVRCSRGLTTDPQADTPAFRSPHFRCIQISPVFAEDRTVAVAGFDGFFLSTDAAETWHERRSILPVNLIVGIAIASGQGAHPAIALSTYGAGPCVSLNSGQSWQFPMTGIEESRTFGIAFSPSPPPARQLFLASNWALYRVEAGGGSWSRVPLADGNRARAGGFGAGSVSTLHDAGAFVLRWLGAAPHRWLRRGFHSLRGTLGLRLPLPGFGSGVTVSPTFDRDHTLYLNAGDRLWRSRDAGQSLTPLLSAPSGFIRALVLSPQHADDRMALAAVDGTLHGTRDGGESWERRWQAPRRRINALAFSPRFSLDQTAFLGSGSQLFHSKDGGSTWEFLASLPTEGDVAIDAILPSSDAAHGGDLYLHAAGAGLFRSRDGGITFRQLVLDSSGAKEDFSQWEDFPDRAPLVQLSPNYDDDRTIVAASHDRVHLSRDAGESWTAFRVAVRYDAARPEISYHGTWTSPAAAEPAPIRSRRTEQTGASARLDFVGTGIRWIAERGPLHGAALVWIDGTPRASIDQWSAVREYPHLCYESPALPAGPHRFEIRTAGRPGLVVLHALEVLGGA